ncbi:hypothetical protein RIVM261_078580 [Rivularia sp. IAM M-261]|nr:hypothetical protein RIVM261_078580 [Rivularia sp. IAM M-261]
MYLQDNTDPFVWLSILPEQPDKMAFLKELKETLQISHIVKQQHIESLQLQQAEAQEKEQLEANKCRRLTAIIINHAKNQRVNTNTLPHLLSKSYDQLCQYIKDHWPELGVYI